MKKVSINKEKALVGTGRVIGAIAGSGVATVLHYAVEAIMPPEIKAVEKMLMGIGELAIGAWISDEVSKMLGRDIVEFYNKINREDKSKSGTVNPDYYGGLKVKEA